MATQRPISTVPPPTNCDSPVCCSTRGPDVATRSEICCKVAGADLLLTATQALDSTLRPKEGASDLVQKTFVVAQRDFQAFEGHSIGELFAWLNRILERQLANQVRQFKQTSMRSVRREVPLDTLLTRNVGLVGDLPGPSDNVALDDERRRVRLAVEQLSPEHQLVLRLRTWQRMPFADVGQQMDRSADAAEKLWLRAVEKLQGILKNVR